MLIRPDFTAPADISDTHTLLLNYKNLKELLQHTILDYSNFEDGGKGVGNVIDSSNEAMYFQGIYTPGVMDFNTLHNKMKDYMGGSLTIESVDLSFQARGQEQFVFETPFTIQDVSISGQFITHKADSGSSVSYSIDHNKVIFKLVHEPLGKDDEITFNGQAQILIMEAY